MNIWKELPRPFFVLAPMDDVTDTVFRQIIAYTAAPDLYITEFVNADGLQSPGRPALLKKLRFSEAEQPLIVQLWGKVPENFYKTAQELADGSLLAEIKQLNCQSKRILQGDAGQGVGEKRTEPYTRYGEGVSEATTQSSAPSTDRVGGFANKQVSTVQGYAGVDINFGCPDKTVLKNGCCAALIENQPLAKDIIAAVQEGVGGKLPVSIKTRLGLNKVDYTWHQFLLERNLAALMVHARTAKQMSKVPADWAALEPIRKLRDQIAPNTKLVGNGDVMTRRRGLELAEQYQLDGVMIGRGVFQDPFVFAYSPGNESPWAKFTKQQRLDLYARHIKLYAATWKKSDQKIHTLNKFCKIYINGFNGAKELREQLMGTKTTDELLKILNTEVKSTIKQ